MRATERAARELAQEQHALVTHRDLVDTGMSTSQIKTLLATNGLEALHRATYRFAGAPVTPLEPIAAAVLAGDGWASARSSGFLYRLRGIEVPRPEITVVGTAAPRLAGVKVHRTDRLDPPDRAVVQGIRSTSIARTLLDIGAVLTDNAYERAANDARFQGLINLDAMWRTLTRLGGRGRPGTARMRRFLESEAPNRAPESELELRMLQLMRRAGLPKPVAQFWIELDAVWCRIDVTYPELNLAIEVDGLVGRMTKEDLQRNDRKATLLGVAGWTRLCFTWDDVNARPEWVVRQIRTTIATLSR